MAIQAKPGEWLFIQKQRVAGETLILGAGQYKDRLVGSELVDCTFDIVNPAAVLVSRCRLINCVFRPRKEVNVGPIGDNYWERCVFHGHYRSTHFGSSSDDIDGPSEWPDVALRGCDFSPATMHACCFRRTDIASTKFPPWPCFTILQPHEHRLVWKDVPLPLPPGYLTNWFSENLKDRTDAEVLHWPTIAKKWAVKEVDPEEVKAIFAGLDFVRL